MSLDLNGIKNLFKQGIEYAKAKYSSPLFNRDDDLCQYQLSLAEQAQDLTSLMNVIWMGNINNTWTSMFQAPQPICTGCELQYTEIQFGVAHTGWYFFYGLAGKFAFNLCFFRIEIAPPDVVAKNNIEKSEAVRWTILGGFGEIGSNVWHTIQPEWIYMKYNKVSNTIFNLSGSGNNIEGSLSVQNMFFQISLNYTDTQNVKHNFSTEMVANSPPSANMPNSCLCAYNLGSFYYSYTDMTVSITVDGNPIQTQGNGWIDHQLIKSGLPNSLYAQSLQTVSNILARKISIGWLWTAIQDNQSGLQYMLTHFFDKKFFQDDVQIQKNINSSIMNVYKNGVPYFNPTTEDMNVADMQMEMVSTVPNPVANINLPSKYKITLPGGKKVILAIATAPNVYPTAFAPYETPALLYDESGQNVIGTGLIEANFYFTNDVFAKRIIQQAGGNPNDPKQYNLVMNTLEKSQSFSQKLLGIIIAFLPILIIVSMFIFVLSSKSDRKIKGMFMVAVFLILYVLYLRIMN